jgi:hypothetical protein
MSASTKHGLKLPRGADRSIAEPQEPATQIGAIGSVLAVTDEMISQIEGQTTALPEAQRKSIGIVQHEGRVAVLAGKRGSRGTQPK